MKAINPATNELIKEYQTHSDEEAAQIIEDMHQEWLGWKKTSFSHREKLMRAASQVLRDEKEKYGKLITAEMGKTIGEAIGEVEKCALACDYYADNAEKILADEIIESDASKSFVSFEPIGIVLAVMPWNFPFWQVFRFLAPALMAGNAGVLKHASNVPGSALAIEEIVQKAGFPKNIFRTLMIGASQAGKVIDNNHVRAVTLTGSELAGSRVAERAGKELKKSVMELGGADAYVVLEDADLEACVQTAVKARMLNAGQSCIAAKRFIVVESVAEKFIQRQKELMEAMIIGDPMDPNTQVAPLARADLVDELDEQVQKSIKEGAQLITGGKKLDRPGNYYAPTILAGVKKGVTVYEEETFGPIATVITVKDEAEAIEVANSIDYGLGGSLWTQDLVRGEKVARQIESGAIFVNGMTKSDPRLPFGGIKKSGFGRELSHYGIKEFVNIKTIWIR